ncbi:MAG: CPBP family intramembrane glutamic endopeptidase [Candidatus Thorarchaeota archaeon]
MVRLNQNRKKEIALKRLRFFYQEVIWAFILIFMFLLIPIFTIPLIANEGSPLYGILFYSARALFVMVGIPLIFPLSNILFQTQKQNVIITEDVSPAFGHIRLYKMTKKNVKYQILYGILIFSLVFLPFDFFSYLLIPRWIEYQSLSLTSSTTNRYLVSDSYFIFLISAIIIQFSVAIAEESISRGLLTKRGSEHFFNISAVIISALYFGLGHFAYILDPISRAYPIWYPFMFFFQSFIVGIILSLFVLRRKWLFPLIIAHTLNNLISAHVVWSFWQGISFTLVAIYLYYPLLITGLCLLVWFFPLIKESLSTGFNMLSGYFKTDQTIEKTKGDIIFRVFIDIIMGLLLFIIGFIVAV